MKDKLFDILAAASIAAVFFSLIIIEFNLWRQP